MHRREVLDSALPAMKLGTILLSLVFLAAAAAPAMAVEGLQLKEAEEKTLEAYDAPNPHFELECTDCHDGKPEFGKDTAATVKFKKGDDGKELGNVGLCYNCHDVSDNIHPVNVDPKKADPPVSISTAVFPLESRGANAGAVVCSTCHFIHTKTAGLKLLRGFPESASEEDVKKAIFTDRRQMCANCHGENLGKKSPHKGKAGDPKSCAFCHAKQPKEGQPVEFSKGLIELCDFCHAATKGAHFLLVNPFADPNLKDEIAKAKVPMMDGAYTCVSCHNPHGGTNEAKFLRDEFVALALKSARVRPHFQKSLCKACHKVKPKTAKGDPAAEKLAQVPLLTDDPNALCNRCHESGLSKANAHPLKPVTGTYAQMVPKDWPLYKGNMLTCLTCHTAGDDFFNPKNPNFLRGAPYENRNDVCWKCHKRDEFSQLNPHQDINSGEGCEFCHDTKPNLKKSVDLEQMKFKGDIVILCIRCHDAYPHPANIDHVIVVDKKRIEEKRIQIPKEFPLDAKGRMTCATCHNPHAGGEKRGVTVGMEICSRCHPY